MSGPEYGQPGTINFYGPVCDQPGINLSLFWQSMINLFLYGREPRVQIFVRFQNVFWYTKDHYHIEPRKTPQA